MVLLIGIMSMHAGAQLQTTCSGHRTNMCKYDATCKCILTKCVKWEDEHSYFINGWGYHCYILSGNEKKDPAKELLASGCQCSIAGYGCRDYDTKCRTHCYRVCQHHATITDENGLYAGIISNSATVTFTLEHPQQVSLKIYDVQGNLVKVLADTYFEEGQHAVSWNTKDQSVKGGVYSLALTSGPVCEIEKIIVAGQLN